MANPFDQFDTQPSQNNVQANPFDQFDSNTGDIISSSIIKGAAGLAGLPADLLTMAGSALGVKPEFAQYLGKDAIIKGIEKLTGTPLYRPEGDVERYAGKAIEGAISTPGRLPMMAMGAASGVGGEFGNEMAGTPGAIAGSIAPYVIPAVAGKAIGGLSDLVRGRTTDIRAGGVLRDVSAGNPAIEASMVGKPDTLTAAQAAAAADDPLWSAMGVRAEANRVRPFTRKSGEQDLSIIERLRGIAGGNTATEARQAQDVFKKAVNTIRGPEREAALENANIAGRMLPKYVDMLNKKRESLISAMQDAGKGFANENAYRQGIVKLQEGSAPGWSQAKIGRLTNRVGEERSFVEDVMTLRNQRKAEGDFIKMQADSLAAHGLKPLKPDAVISKIDNMLKDPRIGPDDISSNAIANVRDKLSAWTNKDGVIDAEAIETIRKRAVNDSVERFMGAADPKAKSKRAAAVTAQIRPLLVKAIEDAGGKGYGEYLKKYAADMDKLASQKLGAKLLEKYEQSPDAFLKLAKGNDPKTVQKIMGTEYDVVRALGGKNNAVQDVALEIERNNRLSKLAGAGKTELANILSKDASKFRIPMWLNRYVTAANKGLDIAEETLNAKTMAKVYEAMESPSKALKLINEIPTSERSAFIKKLIELQKMPKEVRAAQEMSQREY
jgi:hypothetical protein